MILSESLYNICEGVNNEKDNKFSNNLNFLLLFFI